MRARIASLAAAALLAISGCLAGGDPKDDSHDSAHEHADGHGAHAEGAGHGAAHSFRAPQGFSVANAPDLAKDAPFPLEGGALPTLQEAKAFRDKYNSITVKTDEGLAKLRAEGYLKGGGTSADPYVLERFYVERDLTIQSTSKAIVLREGFVGGTLRLNYVGEALYVHHVHAGDLRVNENVKRSGPTAGGLFEANEFGVVGQIRHFLGEFRDNRVGPRTGQSTTDILGDTGLVTIPKEVVFNLDGFHGARVHGNTFDGQVVVKLHGHNHADCFTCPAHDHADPLLDGARAHEHAYTDAADMDALGLKTHHSVRYASLAFTGNEIRVARGPALVYHDRNHAGDDRTANSEPNASLNDPHVHFQDVTFDGNKLLGGGFHLDLFNAPDARHAARNLGILRFLDNDVLVRHAPARVGTSAVESVVGVRLNDLAGIEFLARGNTVRFELERSDLAEDVTFDAMRGRIEFAGFRIDKFELGNATFEGNRVESGTFGVFAQRLAGQAHWALKANDFRTEVAWRGKDVANPPAE